MKKSFTLLEVVISITLFMIVIVFLYKTLDQTKFSNMKFSQKEEAFRLTNDLYNIFLEDVLESSSVKIETTKDKNTIVKLITSNTYHNPFFNNVTYLIGSNDKLVRIESSESFKNAETPYDFYEASFIDILLDNIEFFEVQEDKEGLLFSFQQKNKERVFLNTYKLGAKK